MVSFYCFVTKAFERMHILWLLLYVLCDVTGKHIGTPHPDRWKPRYLRQKSTHPLCIARANVLLYRA